MTTKKSKPFSQFIPKKKFVERLRCFGCGSIKNVDPEINTCKRCVASMKTNANDLSIYGKYGGSRS